MCFLIIIGTCGTIFRPKLGKRALNNFEFLILNFNLEGRAEGKGQRAEGRGHGA
jgi:hypothetical protein